MQSSDSLKTHSSSFMTGVNNKDHTTFKNSCLLCKANHRLLFCDEFKKLKVDKRIELVRQNNLCENCLLANHNVSNCRKQGICTVPGCGKKHTRYIHVKRSNANVTGGVNSFETNSVKLNEAETDFLLPVVPVIVNDKIHTHAFLDFGSTTSFCTKDLVDRLDVKGVDVRYNLNTMSQTDEHKQSSMVSLTLTSLDNSQSLPLSNVFVVDSIPAKCPSLSKDKYAHLHDIPVTADVSEVKLLIGLNNVEALVPCEIRRGKYGEPFAMRTMFGRTVSGPASETEHVTKTAVSHFVNKSSLAC
jgi:hypothetical protein